ncbi:MAG: excinuclease ABC subunit A, partial [Sodaliphilus sp.]|nr:excinuclease ABC subunit A [Sodaliphilus sp.]
MFMNDKYIEIVGARANNLKNINVKIPRNKFVVITGLSGSGKSSLAFDTLYAEGQRRYVESLSAYARQFLGRMSKPECDFIKGLPPAIAVEQKVNNKNSRSTVGTSTEIYDYLRLLFAKIGKTYSPISGCVVEKHTSQDVVNAINKFDDGTRFAVLTALSDTTGRDAKSQLDTLIFGGYSRLEKDGKFYPITDVAKTIENQKLSDYNLLIDRLAVTHRKEDEMRLLDSLSTAFFEGQGQCLIKVWQKDGTIATLTFSKRFEADGITFQEPTELMFNFNNPLGACPTCEGFGRVVGIDENLVVPNKSLSVYDDAIMCWRGQIMSEWKKEFIHFAAANSFPIHKPYFELTKQQKELLWHGKGDYKGIDGFFDYIRSKSYSIQYRVMLSR